MTVFEKKTAVVRNEEVARDTFLMELESPSIASAAKPGQFVMLRVSESSDPLLRRPFSVCSTRDGAILLLLYRVVGKGTRIMAGTKAGSLLSVLGPLGRGFEAPGAGEACLFVAGGMGIAPLAFLARSLGERHISFKAGYGTAAEIIAPELMGMKGIEIALATDDGSAGYHGPVTGLLEKGLGGESRKIVYSCGPLPMLRKVADRCLEKGVACQVSLESAMACGLGACQGCAVKAGPGEERAYLHVCGDGPVFDASAIDWGGE